MHRDDAETMARLLDSSFPQTTLEDATYETYTAFFESLKDASLAYDVVWGVIQSSDHFPSIAKIKDAYSVASRRKLDHAQQRALERGTSTDVPEWVSVWYWLRGERGDMRRLPQQNPDHWLSETERVQRQIGEPISDGEYALLREQWLAAGGLRVSSVNQVMSGPPQPRENGAAVEEQVVKLKEEGPGRCDDCQTDTPRLVVYGKFRVCYLCARLRIKAGAKAKA
jgi:hypothetical protein